MPIIECPKCRQLSAECTRQQVGRSEWYDRYTLTCKKCGHIVSDLVYDSAEGDPDFLTICPFCGEPATSHHSPVHTAA